MGSGSKLFGKKGIISKIHKRIDPLGGYITNDVVDPALGQMGLWNASGRNAAQEAAQKAMEEQNRIALQQAQATRDAADQQSQAINDQTKLAAEQAEQARTLDAARQQNNAARDLAAAEQGRANSEASTRADVDLSVSSDTARKRRRYASDGAGSSSSVRL